MVTINKLLPILILLAALGCGLIAGVFFAFSSFVMRAFARLPPGEGMVAMQSVNVAVLNPLFLSVFVGTAAACGLRSSSRGCAGINPAPALCSQGDGSI